MGPALCLFFDPFIPLYMYFSHKAVGSPLVKLSYDTPQIRQEPANVKSVADGVVDLYGERHLIAAFHHHILTHSKNGKQILVSFLQI